jgi:TRAP-type C4-dicarboxylate transport system substrate-binding protein
MKVHKALLLILAGLALLTLLVGPVLAQQKPSLDSWKPAFDPSGAKYKFTVSNVSNPQIKGVYAGFAIRDELWKRTNGQMFLDYKPFSMLGGEVEVMNQLKMGAIQGMAVSSVASVNLGPRFGVVNLPFLVDSFDKLDKFVASGKLFDHFLMSVDHQGLMALDITGYGNYGWCTTTPVKTLEEAKKVRFRIAEAKVNRLNYQNWGMNPVVMPWPEVPMALKQGVVEGLDHCVIVMFNDKYFDICKYFTQLNYAQGLFIWMFNKDWFNSLPPDLQKTFRETVKDVCAKIREETKLQEVAAIEGAKKDFGATFIKLPDADMAVMKKDGDNTHKAFADEINKLNAGDKYRPENYLKEVQDYLGYSVK